MSAEYEPDLELKAELNRLVVYPAVSRTWSDVEARARRASALRRTRGLRVAVYASIAAVLVAAIAVGSVVGVGRLGQQRFALVIPAEAYASTGARSGHWERHPLLTTEDLGVSVLATDPSDPSVLYAITDSEVLKSSDGAGSWKQISTMRAWAIAVDPASPSTVYLAASEALLRSDDGGATWTDLSGPGLPLMRPYGVSAGLWFDPTTTPSTLYMNGTLVGSEARGNSFSWFPSPMCRSTDRGETWIELTKAEAEQVDQARRKQLPPSPSAPAQRVFEALGSPLPGGGVPLTDADTGYVLQVLVAADAIVATSDPSIFYVGTGEGVYKSTDGGRTWRKASPRMVSSWSVWDVIPDPSSPSTLYAAASAGIFKTTDGGVTWNMILPGDGGSVVMAPSSPSTLYASTSAGVFRTDNGGADWTRLPAEWHRHPALVLVASDKPDAVLAIVEVGARWQGELFRSSDGGNTWSQVLQRLEPWGLLEGWSGVVAAGPLNPSTLFAGAGTWSGPEGEWVGHVLRSTDAGATWAIVSPEEWAGTWVSDFDVDPHTPSNVYVVRVQDHGGTETRSVSRSLDGGTTWEDVELGGLAKDISELVFDPRSPDTLYVLTESSIDDTANVALYRSTDGGATWENIIGDLSDTQGLNIMIDPALGGGLYAIAGTDLYRWVPGGN